MGIPEQYKIRIAAKSTDDVKTELAVQKEEIDFIRGIHAKTLREEKRITARSGVESEELKKILGDTDHTVLNEVQEKIEYLENVLRDRKRV